MSGIYGALVDWFAAYAGERIAKAGRRWILGGVLVGAILLAAVLLRLLGA